MCSKIMSWNAVCRSAKCSKGYTYKRSNVRKYIDYADIIYNNNVPTTWTVYCIADCRCTRICTLHDINPRASVVNICFVINNQSHAPDAIEI